MRLRVIRAYPKCFLVFSDRSIQITFSGKSIPQVVMRFHEIRVYPKCLLVFRDRRIQVPITGKSITQVAINIIVAGSDLKCMSVEGNIVAPVAELFPRLCS